MMSDEIPVGSQCRGRLAPTQLLGGRLELLVSEGVGQAAMTSRWDWVT